MCLDECRTESEGASTPRPAGRCCEESEGADPKENADVRANKRDGNLLASLLRDSACKHNVPSNK